MRRTHCDRACLRYGTEVYGLKRRERNYPPPAIVVLCGCAHNPEASRNTFCAIARVTKEKSRLMKLLSID